MSPVRGAVTLFGDYVFVVGSRVVSVPLSVATVVLAAQVLTPAEYGALAYATAIAMLLLTLGSTWTSAAVVRYGREELESRRPLAPVTWERVIVSAPAAALTAAGVLVLYAAGTFPDEVTRRLLVIALVYGLALIACDHVVYLLQMLGRMIASSVGVVVRQTIAVVALLVLVLADASVSPEVVVAIFAGAWLLLAAVLAPTVWRVAVWPPSLDRALRRRIVAFSLPLLAFTISQYVMSTVDLFVIGFYETATEVGTYAVAYQGYSALAQIASASVVVLTPLFVSMRAAGRGAPIARFVGRGVGQVTFFASVAAGLAAPAMPMVVPALFGAEFREAAVPFVVLLAPAVLLVATSLLAPVLLLHEATRAVSWISVAAAAVNVVGDLVLIGPLGLGTTGAAVATAVAVAVIAGGYMHVAARVAGTVVRWPVIIGLAPVTAGIVLALALPGGFGAVIGAGVVAMLSIALLVSGAVFVVEDAEVVRRLAMPASLRRFVLGVIYVGTRR